MDNKPHKRMFFAAYSPKGFYGGEPRIGFSVVGFACPIVRLNWIDQMNADAEYTKKYKVAGIYKINQLGVKGGRLIYTSISCNCVEFHPAYKECWIITFN